ncbi:hypothetical protein HHO41_03150 [Bacillus sp. DNRA2]|uniref:hypothetical protein n=1 Tax=Bacillus sp. DNRA2 TaxID=2723053 RepID=UPI00145D06BE|nr:hypothetical protein [Bacillus sp. DNRA2]NMD69271.1 hypothetical protein [Bacillus sp. DNRA2]
MNVIASFKLNKQLERALAELEQLGIGSSSILALPLETKFDRKYHYDKQNMIFESAPIIGMILMLLGTIYGFVLDWGPIFWAIIGLVSGMGLGFLIDSLRIKRKDYRNNQIKADTEVFLMIHCNDNYQALFVKEKLWEHDPVGVTIYDGSRKSSEI